MKDELIHNHLVVGIRDSTLSEGLQLEPELTLDKAKQFIRQRESVRAQQAFLQQPQIKQESSSLDAVKQSSTRRKLPAIPPAAISLTNAIGVVLNLTPDKRVQPKMQPITDVIGMVASVHSVFQTRLQQF